MIVIAAASALISAEVLPHRDIPSDFVRLIHSFTTLLHRALVLYLAYCSQGRHYRYG